MVVTYSYPLVSGFEAEPATGIVGVVSLTAFCAWLKSLPATEIVPVALLPVTTISSRQPT